MMQESVYTRMVLNQTVQKTVIDTLKRNKPASGLVQVMVVTEKQFTGTINISGEYKTNVIDSDERLIIL